jgi:hypothetical protein
VETFQVAHLHIQQVNVVIIFLDTSFDRQLPQQQNAVQARLQSAAASAGLAGNVVPVWLDESGRTKFIAPPQQHPFFKNTSFEQLATQVNRTLTVG